MDRLSAILSFLLLPTLAGAATVTAPLSSTVLITSPPGRLVDHSSSMCELPNGEMLACWMHGDFERAVESTVYTARRSISGTWSTPVETIRHPSRGAGNPILFCDEQNVVWMFYSLRNEDWVYTDSGGTPIDGAIQNGAIYFRKSYDYGQTWSAPVLMRGRMSTPDRGWLTGIKPIRLANGKLLLPVYRDVSDVTPTGATWHSSDGLCLISGDDGYTWQNSEAIFRSPWSTMPTVQPLASGRLLMWMRTPSSVSGGKMWRTSGPADGMTWDDPAIPSTSPDGSQARFDLVRLASGKHVLICSPRARHDLQVSLSADETATWSSQKYLESSSSTATGAGAPGTFAYPTIIQTRDGLIHAIHTYDGYFSIKHVVISEPWFTGAATTYKPNVGITSPVQGQRFSNGALTISAAAHDRDGTVNKVEFYEGAIKLGEDTSAPYQLGHTFAAGSHTITARATDNAGQTLASAPVTFSVGLAGALSGSNAGAPASVNLTSEGTLDWVHLGLGDVPTALNRKSGANLISGLTRLDQAAPASYNDSSVQVSWSGGSPTASASGTRAGIFANYCGSGFEFTVPADTGTRTLKLHVGVYRAQGALEAWLSDSSAPRWRSTALSNVSGVTAGVYTLTYQAGAPGQTLRVRWITAHNFGSNSTPNYGDIGNVALQAITLSGSAPGDTTPPAAVGGLNDTGAITTTSVGLTWTAPGDDGTVGTATSYLVRYAAGGVITSDAGWNAATVVAGAPTPQVAGTTQGMTVGGLAPDTLYGFAVRAVDEAGNLGALSGACSARTLAISGGGPPATPAAPTVSNATSATPTLSGTTTPGATVTIRDNGTVVGTVTANGSGTWTWTPSSPLGAGTHVFTVTAGNSSGTSAASPGVTVTVAGAGGGGSSAGGGSSGGGCGLGGGLAALLLTAWWLPLRLRRG